MPGLALFRRPERAPCHHPAAIQSWGVQGMMMTPAAPRLVEAFKVVMHACADAGAAEVARALGAASLVVTHGGDEDAVVSALLLPAVDSDDVALAHLATRFGPRVGVILAACRDDHRAANPTADVSRAELAAWLASRRHRLLRLDAADDGTLLVAACDALHAVRVLVEALESPEVGLDALRASPGGDAWGLRDAHAIAQLCMRRGTSPARALDRAVDRLHALAHRPMREGLDG